MKKTILAAGLVAGSVLAAPANAFILIDNYDFYLNGANGASDADTFLGGTGGQLLNVDAFQSNGNSFVVQEASGAGGTVATGDRFYDVGYLNISSADVGGSTTNLGPTLYNGTDASLYFFFELTGTVDLSGAVPTYTFDGGQVNLMLDNDGGILTGNVDDAMNRASDGASFSSLLASVSALVSGGTFDMSSVLAGIPLLNGDASLTTDATLLTLMSLDPFFSGNTNLGGDIPTGFGVPNSQQTGDFGVDMAVTGTCVANVAFDEFGNDLCDSANANADLSNFFWAVSGQTTGKNLSDAINGTDAASGNALIFQSLTIGDTADLGVSVPEPEMVTLIGLGLLGIGATRRRRT